MKTHHHHNQTHDDAENTPLEYLKFSLIIAFIAGFSLMLAIADFSWLEYLRLFMGVFFVVFAGFKFVDIKMFAIAYSGYDLVAKRFKVYGYLYPFLELGLGILYLADLIPFTRDILTVGLMTVGSAGVLKELTNGSKIRCACLGKYIKLPLTTVSLVEDVGMGAMALVMLISR